MLRNMAASLLRHETIRTTVPKAKELRRYVEPLITLGKIDSQANRRRAFARLRDAEIVVKLFDELGPRFKARPGGYTRILHMANRAGDNADMALMALVDQAAPAEAAKPADEDAKQAQGPQEEGCGAGGGRRGGGAGEEAARSAQEEDRGGLNGPGGSCEGGRADARLLFLRPCTLSLIGTRADRHGPVAFGPDTGV